MRFHPSRKDHRRSGAPYGVLLLSVASVAFASLGCSQGREGGFADQGKLQIQFVAPPGAEVTVDSLGQRTHQIGTYESKSGRLEQSPERFCVFNLSPGRYEFKYIAAEGLEDVSLYGELDVKCVTSDYASTFRRRAFVPISVPSDYYKRMPGGSDELYAYRGERYRAAIDEMDLMRLRQGDVVEKVFVVADLERADKAIKKTRRELAVLDRELEYAEARFRDAYLDFRLAADDPTARLFGTDRSFIGWEKKRTDIQQKIDEKQAKLTRTEALLRGDRVVTRRGMLVLATEEVVKPYRDIKEASEDLGEVVLVMRIGGRHMQWGPPPAAPEMVAEMP